MELIPMMDLEKYIKEVINMMRANYGRRKDDNEMKISLFPKWVDIMMIISKYMIIFTPFIIASIMMFFRPESIYDNWLLTCVYLLSLNNLLWSTEK